MTWIRQGRSIVLLERNHVLAQHDNVVRFYGSFVQDQCLWLIMNYLSGGKPHDLSQ